MLRFILRRVGSSVVVLLGASLLMFVLVINSGDPLADLRESMADNREQLIERRVAYMGLDQPWYVRYWDWLRGVAGCFRLQCDLGTTRNGVETVSLLGQAASSTLRLVTLSVLAAIVVGVALGMLTAIRQYSGLDYAVTFGAFLFFSLPVFWAAVLLKEFGAIRFNDWIADPGVGLPWLLGSALVLGLLTQGVIGGPWRRRLVAGAGTAAFVVAALAYFDAVDWFRRPALGVGVVAVAAVAAAVLVTSLVAGLSERRVLAAGVATAAAGSLSALLLRGPLTEPTWGLLLGLAVAALAVSVAIGRLVGGRSWRQAVLVSTVTGAVTSLLVVADLLLSHWAGFLRFKPRPISTIGAETPNFPGGFWEQALDAGSQLVLPTVLLTLVSVASYARFTRSSMLEVLGQDYIRTARAKGAGERAVIAKHAFRNALIPITTIVALNFAGLIGGAVITETVFGWKGMGELFRTGLLQVDPAPVMAFFLVTGVAAVSMNLVADIAYTYLDPRIRR